MSSLVSNVHQHFSFVIFYGQNQTCSATFRLTGGPFYLHSTKKGKVRQNFNFLRTRKWLFLFVQIGFKSTKIWPHNFVQEYVQKFVYHNFILRLMPCISKYEIWLNIWNQQEKEKKIESETRTKIWMLLVRRQACMHKFEKKNSSTWHSSSSPCNLTIRQIEFLLAKKENYYRATYIEKRAAGTASITIIIINIFTTVITAAASTGKQVSLSEPVSQSQVQFFTHVELTSQQQSHHHHHHHLRVAVIA